LDPPELLVSDGFRPHLSPDGSKVVFTRLSSTAADAQSDIWVINTDGTGLLRLTNTSIYSEYSPQWHPDGLSIGYVRKSGQYFSSTSGQLREIDPDGTNDAQCTSFDTIMDFCFYKRSDSVYVVAELDTSDLWLSMPTWPSINGFALRRNSGSDPRFQSIPSGPSPNITIFDPTLLGSRGAFVFNPVNLDETEVNNSGRFPWPFPSPNGTKVIAGADGGVSNGLYTMNVNGSNLVQLTTSKDIQPSWSQTTVVFVRIPVSGSLEHGNIYKLVGVEE